MGEASQESLGERVKRLRQQRGWLQRDLARTAGLSQPVIARIERGVYPRLQVQTLTALADAFQVSVDFLLGRVTPASEDDGERCLLPVHAAAR